MKFIDAHHHLWDLSACHYPWLMAKGIKRFFGDPTPIQKDYLPSDFLNESQNWIPQKSIHIQVGVEDKDSINESIWLQKMATSPENKGFPHGIVAFCDLGTADAHEQLSTQIEAAQNVRGIRHIVGRHIEEDNANGSHQLLLDKTWINNLARLPSLGLSFDLQLIPQQLESAFQVLKELPELNVALCHCGSPWDQTEEGLKHWRTGLEKLAQLPNIYCKISGLGMFNNQWTTEQTNPIILDCINIFGIDRCMFGSNFPVDKLYSSYDKIWDSYNTVTANFSETERNKLFLQNAETFYRL